MRQSLNISSRRRAHTVCIFSPPHLGLSIGHTGWKRLIQQEVTGCNEGQKLRDSKYISEKRNGGISSQVLLRENAHFLSTPQRSIGGRSPRLRRSIGGQTAPPRRWAVSTSPRGGRVRVRR